MGQQEADKSNGYEALVPWWRARPTRAIGPRVVLEWARGLAAGGAVLDIGCGDGIPMSVAMAQAGFEVYGVDAAPGMVAGFRENLPGAPVECAPVEESAFFNRTFDGVLSWGLMFLLQPDMQREMIARVARVLRPGGLFLFTAPWPACEWDDAMTGQRSVSLGRDEYVRVMEANGLTLTGEAEDEGENHYYFSRRMS